MSSTFTRVLVLGLVLLFTNPSPVSANTRKRCRNAPFIPGHTIGGQGYDVVTLQRKAAVIDMTTYLRRRKCRLYRNPLQANQQQKVPVSISRWTYYRACNVVLFHSAPTSIGSLSNTLANQDSVNWASMLNWNHRSSRVVGGTRSNSTQFATALDRQDRFVFMSHRMSCTRYSYTLSNRARLSRQFRRDLARLPKVYTTSSRPQYREFIQTYGTHFITKVYLGGRMKRVSAIRTCLASVNGLSEQQAKDCVKLGLLIGFGKKASPADQQSCARVLTNRGASSLSREGLHEHYTEVTGGTNWRGIMSFTKNDSVAFNNWLKTLSDRPDVTRYSLSPLYRKVANKNQRAGVKAAIEQYLNENALPKTDRQLQCNSNDLTCSCCPRSTGTGNLTLTVVRAWGLDGDWWGSTEAYAKIWYGSFHRRTRMIRSDNPRWNARYNVGKVNAGLRVKVQVWDEDVWSDDHLGTCEKYLKHGTHVHNCHAKGGGFQFSYTLTCGRHVTGDKCSKYKPEPQ